MAPKPITPILTSANKGTVAMPWAVSPSEYSTKPSAIEVLVNGQAAFADIHEKIARAEKSICMMCWGFQSSMYFVRNGNKTIKYSGLEDDFPTQIGKLLRHKAGKGIIVRILVFGTPELNSLGLNFAAAMAIKEINLPGKGIGKDRPDYLTDSQYVDDKAWHLYYPKNLYFKTHGFVAETRFKTAIANFLDSKETTLNLRMTLVVAPSHHQKMILVDYENEKKAIGYVMGHNMLDHYWDTDKHHRATVQPNTGRHGNVPPLHDFSTRLMGPILKDLFANFKEAWELSNSKQGLDFPWLTLAGALIEWIKAPSLPQCPDYKAENIPTKQGLSPADIQVLRTHKGNGKEDIKKAYLQAVNNVNSFIYIENQYFRWPPLAKKIKETAQQQFKKNREVPIYVFAISNTSDAGVGSGNMNTYRMLEALGRVDGMPKMAELELKDKLSEEFDTADLYSAEDIKRMTSFGTGQNSSAKPKPLEVNGKVSEAARKAKIAELVKHKLEAAIQDRTNDEGPLSEQKIDGVVVNVCCLAPSDTPAGVTWTEVYIHAKMMMVNDAFLTIGSANINTRSMEVDTELNITLARPEITGPLRQKLWQMHTGKPSPAILNAQSLKATNESWRDLMKQNAKRKAAKQAALCSLLPFRRDSIDRSTGD